MTSSDTTRQPAADAIVDAASGKQWSERVDAVRYAVLRKLAPGLRHALMGELQAIQLSAEFAVRMLRAGSNLAEVRDNVSHIPEQCTAVVKTGRSVIEWLAPEEGTTASLSEGVNQCLKLAGEDWFLQNIEATTNLPQLDVQVPKAALQELMVTALLVLTDMYDQPIDLDIAARLVEDHVDVALRACVAKRVASIPPIRSYRKLVWADLELLAKVYGVPCICDGGTASLQFQRLRPA